jgi:hypothetical protein
MHEPRLGGYSRTMPTQLPPSVIGGEASRRAPLSVGLAVVFQFAGLRTLKVIWP